VAVVEGSYHLSRGRRSSLSSVGTTSLECSVFECGQVYSTVRCVAGNVFCSRSSSQRHDSKRTAAHAPKQCLPSARPKLSATNSTLSCVAHEMLSICCVGNLNRIYSIKDPNNMFIQLCIQILIFLVATPRNIEGGHRRYGVNLYLHLQGCNV
jgi:hypothetical protein